MGRSEEVDGKGELNFHSVEYNSRLSSHHEGHMPFPQVLVSEGTNRGEDTLL